MKRKIVNCEKMESVTSHDLYSPLPLSQTVTLSQTPSPLWSVTYFMDGPRCFGTKWYGDVPRAWSTQDGDTGNEDNSSFARFIKLDKYAMLSFAMTSGLESDFDKFDKFKIIIMLRWALKFGDIWRYLGPYKNFDFLYNPLVLSFFCNFS